MPRRSLSAVERNRWLSARTPKERIKWMVSRHPGSEEWHHRSLTRIINAASEAYYYDGTSPMSDADYDAHLRMLQNLEELYPHLLTPDSPTQRVMN